MHNEKKIQVINEVRRLQAEISTLRTRRFEVLTGVQNASLSAGTGSKSYSNWTPAQFDEAIAADLRMIAQLKQTLRGKVHLFQCVQQGRR